MQSTTLEFSHTARTTYTAVKRLFDKSTKFGSVRFCENLNYVKNIITQINQYGNI